MGPLHELVPIAENITQRIRGNFLHYKLMIKSLDPDSLALPSASIGPQQVT